MENFMKLEVTEQQAIALSKALDFLFRNPQFQPNKLLFEVKEELAATMLLFEDKEELVATMLAHESCQRILNKITRQSPPSAQRGGEG